MPTRVHENCRVISSGTKVQLYRYPGVDVTVCKWRKRTNIDVHIYGSFADDAVWIPVKLSDRRLFDVDSRDLDKLLRRDPAAEIISPS